MSELDRDAIGKAIDAFFGPHNAASDGVIAAIRAYLKAISGRTGTGAGTTEPEEAHGVLRPAPGDIVEALKRLIYETTHLSPVNPDGSHWCKISAEALAQARAALQNAGQPLSGGETAK